MRESEEIIVRKIAHVIFVERKNHISFFEIFEIYQLLVVSELIHYLKDRKKNYTVYLNYFHVRNETMKYHGANLHPTC